MLMMEDLVFGHGTTTRMLCNPDHSRAGKFGKKVKAKQRTKVDQQETEKRSLVKSKHRNQSCGQKKIVPWCSDGKRGKERLFEM